MKTSGLLKLCLWGALSVPGPGVLANTLAHDGSVRGLEGGQALLAIETHRAAIIERLVADYAEALAHRGLDADALRAALTALRADQLLAATLVNTLDEVLRVAHEPMVATGPAGQRYVAITPTEAIELRAVPEAQAYLVREGAALRVVQPAELQRTGHHRVVGYFTAEREPSVTTVVVQPERLSLKDGAGSGSNSWIGYTAGSNIASGSGSAVAAGTFNAATNTGAFVGAGTSNQANGISSLVIGGFDNRATAIDSLVGSGAGNRATGARSIVVGGGYNLASGGFSFIGGGGRDGTGSTAAGTDLKDNIASGSYSVVVGGQGNRASGTGAAVLGGTSNTASGNRAIAMGFNATASLQDTFVWSDGALYNPNNGLNTFNILASAGLHLAPPTNIIMGSSTRQNITLWGNPLTANTSYGIGVQNSNTYFRVDIGAADQNGFNFFKGGIHSNTSGDPGAGGVQLAVLDRQGSFQLPLALDQHIRLRQASNLVQGLGAQNSTVYLRTNDNVGFYVGGTHNDNVLDAGGGSILATMQVGAGSATVTGNVRALTFTGTSDRAQKSSFASVDAKAILAKVASMPISTWVYNTEKGTGVRHIGPVSQDFSKAFNVGYDDKSISLIDASGVALTAIKGLSELVKEKTSEIAMLKRELAAIKKKLGM